MSSKNKQIIIAGSNGGVGSAITKKFNENNWDVIELSRKKSTEKDTLHRHVKDFMDVNNLNNIAKKIFSKNHNIDAFINCIGQWSSSGVTWDEKTFNNNFLITKNIFDVFSPFFLKQDFGRFITVSSIDDLYPNTNSFVYSCSKSAVTTLSNLYRKKYRDTNVNFDELLPGGINTKNRDKTEDKSIILQPEDMADLCFYLANVNSRVAFEDIVLYPKKFSYNN